MPSTTAPLSPPTCARSAELRHHRQLVRRIAGRIRPRLPAHVEMDELVQAGMIGLNEALTRFEKTGGASFETFASRRIQGAMLDSLRANDTLTRDQRSRQREMRAAVHRLEHRFGRAPRAKEVANELGWTMEAFHACMVDAGHGKLRAGDTMLEPPEGEAVTEWSDVDDTTTGHDEHSDPLRALQQRQRHGALADALSQLDERERRVMELLYEQDMRQQDVGALLGVTGSRVSRLHDEIVAKLRRRLRDW